MSRLARVVVPDLPHHVTQRGNRREPIFFEDGDQEVYRDLLAEQCARRGVACWAYCLMPNREPDFASLIAPEGEDGAFAALREAEGTGRPLGTADFVADLERRLGRPLARRAPGRRPRPTEEPAQPALL